MGANPHTFAGLSGIGDLIVTCASMHSRNRRAGILIGKGYTKDEAMKEVQMVVEGVFSAKAALELSKKYNIEMPIVEQVNKVLFEDKPAAEAVKMCIRDRLMTEYDSLYPEYGFARHKGYGTKVHIEAIKEYGPCPIHRRTFIKNFI